MPVVSFGRFLSKQDDTSHNDNVPTGTITATDEKGHGVSTTSLDDSSSGSTDFAHMDSDTEAEPISKKAQAGVQKIEAVTQVWSKKALVAAYIGIWIIEFVNSMQQNMGFGLLPYAVSSFQNHSLTPTVGVLSGVIGGLTRLPLAKVLDIWGRPQGFALMVGFLTIGLIMMAACQNVETYAAAQVFYWVGLLGVGYCNQIFIADTSSLKFRAFMFAFINSPFIITSWIGGPIAEAFLARGGFNNGWRWGYGTFAIVTPIICMLLFFLFTWNYAKAKRQGITIREPSGRTMWQSIKHYSIEFDLLGLLLIVAGISLVLLPFNIYTFQPDGWRSPTIIGMLVGGVVFLVLFVLYEKFGAPVTFLPYKLLSDRTILASFVLVGVLFVSFTATSAYFSSFLQVVSRLSVTHTAYVNNIFNVGSCLTGLVVGLLILFSGKFKWLALYIGLPLEILAVGLQIKFLQPGESVGFLIMTQIFLAVAGGILTICLELAAMASTTHQYIAVVLAVQGMFASVGGAIGSTISAAIWTGIVPARLEEYLPAEAKADAVSIYASIVTQLSYEPGTAARDAIERTYGDGMRLLTIFGTSVLVVGWVAIAFWRDLRVKDFKQTKGNVI